jgi:MoxR-like ATPase
MDYKDFTTLGFPFPELSLPPETLLSDRLIRSWIAGFAASRLILLEGLSGTGKSTLPRMFLEFVGGKAYFFPVQATWRDRSDIVGYYSDFTGQFKETELLKHLYEASYIPQKP